MSDLESRQIAGHSSWRTSMIAKRLLLGCLLASATTLALAQAGGTAGTPSSSYNSSGAPGGSKNPDTSGTMAGRTDTADFERLDGNHDNRLSYEEVRETALASRFRQLDTDHDGRLTPKEFAATDATSR
jgi:hypothetical protein